MSTSQLGDILVLHDVLRYRVFLLDRSEEKLLLGGYWVMARRSDLLPDVNLCYGRVQRNDLFRLSKVVTDFARQYPRCGRTYAVLKCMLLVVAISGTKGTNIQNSFAHHKTLLPSVLPLHRHFRGRRRLPSAKLP